jgi:hypothetical protein
MARKIHKPEETSIATQLAKLAYIGGYGRSGSTLLEYLMTANPKVVACGEVASCLGKKQKLRCTCSQTVKQCSVWRFLYALSSQASDWTHRDLTVALLEYVSSDYEIMIDSSKTAWGAMTTPFTLRQRLGKDFNLIHLVRDPRAVCWSSIQSKRKRAALSNRTLRCIWSALGWWLANLSCEYFRRLYPDQYVRVRYEDLARSPSEVLQTLLTRVLPGVAWNPKNIGRSDNRHQLHGNRMRRRQLSSFQAVREDVRWMNEMPLRYRRLVTALSWPLRRIYGYP